MMILRCALVCEIVALARSLQIVLGYHERRSVREKLAWIGMDLKSTAV